LEKTQEKDQKYLKDVSSFYKAKGLTDVVGSLIPLLSNLNAPSPDTLTAPTMRAPNLVYEESAKRSQIEDQVSQMRVAGRTYAQQIGRPDLIPAIEASVMDYYTKTMPQLAEDKMKFMNTVAENEANVSNQNAQARFTTDATNQDIIRKDNMARSALISKLSSQLVNAPLETKAGLINVENMGNQNDVIAGIIKGYQEKGEYDKLILFLESLQKGGLFKPTYVPANTITEVAKT
jgi:hypothetical protein